MRKHSLRQIANRYLETNNRGSPRDKKYRYFIIHKMIEDLFILGDVPPNWQALTPKHLQLLVQHWCKRKIKPSTMMNHMTVIRKFLSDMGNDSVNIDNQSLGIKRKISSKNPSKISPDIWQKTNESIARVLLGLQIHFGLTLSEAMRLLPGIHVQEHKLWLTREITFNSQDRIVPFRSKIQEDIIGEFNVLTQNQHNLISSQGYRSLCFSWRKALKTLKLPHSKSYRYLYAQQTQQQLSSALSNYELSLLIMDEMGLKSRTTLWRYLHE